MLSLHFWARVWINRPVGFRLPRQHFLCLYVPGDDDACLLKHPSHHVFRTLSVHDAGDIILRNAHFLNPEKSPSACVSAQPPAGLPFMQYAEISRLFAPVVYLCAPQRFLSGVVADHFTFAVAVFRFLYFDGFNVLVRLYIIVLNR